MNAFRGGVVDASLGGGALPGEKEEEPNREVGLRRTRLGPGKNATVRTIVYELYSYIIVCNSPTTVICRDLL